MSFYRVTWSEKYGSATLHNWGCTFSCPFCSYKLRSGAKGHPGFASPKPEHFLSVDELKKALLKVQPRRVSFMGGEPTIAKELDEMILFCKKELGVETILGHTNGSRLTIPHLDGANVGFKAWNDALHLQLTGRPKTLIYGNFTDAYRAGKKLSANIVFIPELVGLREVEGLVHYLADLNPEIPFHIMGYIPVPGLLWERPTKDEIFEAEALAKKYLKNVNYSHLTSEEALDLSVRDDRFHVEIIAGV